MKLDQAVAIYQTNCIEILKMLYKCVGSGTKVTDKFWQNAHYNYRHWLFVYDL